MEMECLTEFPHTHMDRRPRKRPRLGWDLPQVPKVPSFPVYPFYFADIRNFAVTLNIYGNLIGSVGDVSDRYVT